MLFGSGEMSPTGRKIHEEVFKAAKLSSPVKIGILETPTGYEVNAIHGWPERIENFFKKSLKNFKPIITRIRAWRKDGEYSTNDPATINAILEQEYLYCGAGSPIYTIKHLMNSLAYQNINTAFQNGTVLCFGSATAIAMSRFALPVYEIFKTGADLYWEKGLNFYETIGLSNLIIIPHWNNKEGEDFDTTRCWMGKDRFEKLQQMLPKSAVLLGIDEQTACIINVREKTMTVTGVGEVHVFGSLAPYTILQQ